MVDVMILGTFHFKNRNKDMIYGKYNILEDEICDLLESLKGFNPTKIAVEYNKELDDELKSQYKKFQNNKLQLTSDEIYQIGFRLAKELGHSKLHGIDWNKNVDGSIPMGDVLEQISKSQKKQLAQKLIKDGKDFMSYIETSKSLKNALKTLNSKEMINRASWLNERLIHFNTTNQYVGNKWLMGWHYRNLNITSNLLDILEDGDRVLVIYGSGHTKILKYLIEQDPQVNVLSPLNYL